MRIAIGADHAGYDLKNYLYEKIESMGHSIVDVGAHTLDPDDDYPDFAKAVGKQVSSQESDRGILVCGSGVGASIAAEIGTMRVSEQIDALETLSFDPISFLIMPRIISGAIMFPVMVVMADFFGILGGYIGAISSLDVTAFDFVRGLKDWFHPWDAIFGIIKAFFFGITITSIACYFGFYTTGGAQGVGKTTTTTVVVSCLAILILDYILAALLL